MNYAFRNILLPLIVVTGASHKAGADELRPFTVRDSIEMVTFSDPYARLNDRECKISPDGEHFLVITTKGNLGTNQVESTLAVYSARDVSRYLHDPVGHAPPTQLLFRKAAAPVAHQINSYGSLITKAQWSSDSSSILSLVEQANGYRHLFRSYLSGTTSIDLTPEDVDITDFSEAGGTIAYLATEHMPAPDVVGEPINSASSDLTGLSLFHILFPEKFPDPSSFWPAVDLWVRYKDHNRKINNNGSWHFPSSAAGLQITISPNGRSLIAAKPVPSVPTEWSRYKLANSTASFAPAHIGADRSGKGFSWPWQYIQVDLDTMTVASLVNAPSGFLEGYIDALQAVWSADSQRVLFTNTYLPLSTPVDTQSNQQARACAAAVYIVATKATSCVEHARFPEANQFLLSATFGASPDEVYLQWSGEGVSQTEAYAKTEKGWVLEPQKATVDPAQMKIEVFIKQDINEPPTLWAAEPRAGLTKLLWNPNPQLTDFGLGKASVYTWRDHTGYKWRAGLVLPPNYVQGNRYPLVIQTHGFYNEHEFLVDGSFTTGFAARALAAAGIIVLQMEDRADRHSKPAQQEPLLAVEGFQSAVEQLDKDGFVDVSRVGIIGFSRAAWYVEEALIHAPGLFRAASLIDGVDESYLTYMLFAPDNPEAYIEWEAPNGGKPFGRGIESWLTNASGFNLDKVQAPVRIEALGNMSILGEWEVYSSLYQQGKPVDFVYIPHGQHILQQPQARYASQQGNVDWFRFWLEGYKDLDPAKREQYERWAQWLKPHYKSDSFTSHARN